LKEKGAATIILVGAVMTCVFVLPLFYLGCDTPIINGLKIEDSVATVITDNCAGCDCPQNEIQLAQEENGQIWATPCAAGCQDETGNSTFGNCGCIGKTLKNGGVQNANHVQNKKIPLILISGSVCSQWFTFCTYPLKTDTKYINVSHFYWVFSNLQAKQQIFYIIYLQKVELSHQMSVVLFEKALKRGFIEKFISFLFIRCFLSGKFLKKKL
jgi:hypothetical protein